MARPYIGGSNAAVESKTSAYTILPADHGKTFVLSGGAVTVSLPTMSSSFTGFSCKIISGDDSEHVLNGGASLMYGSGIMTGDKTQFYAGISSLTLIHTVIGDSFSIISDGTNWYCFNSAVNGITSG